MKEILIISDFVEGLPVVASRRYEDLVSEFSNHKLSSQIQLYTMSDYYLQNKENETITYKFLENKFQRNVLEDTKKTDSKPKKFNNKFQNKIKFQLKKILYGQFFFNLQNKAALQEILQEIKNRNIQQVFATIPGIAPLYVCDYIKKNIPEIKITVEVRDILNQQINQTVPDVILKKAENMMIKNSENIITLSEGIRENYRHYPNVFTVYNGYAEQKFESKRVGSLEKYSEYIEVSHVGSLYSGRSVKEFIEAINQYAMKKKKKIRFNIVGVLDSVAYKEISKVKVDGNLKINITGAVSHEEAISYLLKSEFLVILTHKKGSEYAIPGKVFEYLGAQKPIIAVTTDPELVELINNRYGVCAEHNMEDIYCKIEKILTKPNYDFSDVKKFTRRNQIEKIINIMSNKENKQYETN